MDRANELEIEETVAFKEANSDLLRTHVYLAANDFSISFPKIAAILFFSILFVLALFSSEAASAPSGPTYSILSNSTKSNAAGTQINDTQGGRIYVMQFNATSQNSRWKAFVGNVSGKLSLQDATDARIFDWNLTTTAGEVYATRNNSAINWSGVACASAADLIGEDQYLSQNSQDNVSTTFNLKNHTAFYIGTQIYNNNTCFSLHTYVSSASQYTAFQEIVVKDSRGPMIYVTTLENDVAGYNGANYDFQMIVPENGSAGWSGNIPYYFYVELD